MHGNTSTCSFTVTVVDNQPPKITCPANITVNAAPGQCASNVTFSVTATDNCGVQSIVSSPASGYAFPVGTTTVNSTATDIHGNPSTCSFTVTVIDNQPPSITCPATVTVNADNGRCYATSVSLGTPVTGDNCGVASVVNNAPSQYLVGDTTVTWTVTDVHGLTATCNQTVTVNDNQLPTITCPVSLTDVPTDAGQCYATGVNLGAPTTADNCGVATVSNDAPAQFAKGDTTVTWTVKDIHGNSATCTQKVTVKDHQNPTITQCPASITVNTGPSRATCDQTASWTPPIASDNCGIASFTSDHNPGDAFPVGTTKVTYTAKDDAGNTSTCCFNVIVLDTTPPLITGCPGNITVGTGPGRTTCNQVATWTAPTATDACSSVTTTSNHSPGETFPLGITPVTYTAKDAAGNTSACTFTVNVVDTTPPIVLCKNAMLDLDSSGHCTLTTAAVDGGCSDACGSVSLSLSKSNFDCSNLGSNIVTLTATDSNGNHASGSATVVVVDDQRPTITCAPDQYGVFGITPVPDFTSGTLASDNCAFTKSQYPPAGTTGMPVGTNIVTVTATDTSTNTTSCPARFIVQYLASGTCGGVATHQILQPINPDGSSVFKQGSTVPAKFRVCDGLGNSIGTPGLVTRFALYQTSAGQVTGVNEIVDSTTPDNAFRWDPSGQQWIFNISTKSLKANMHYYYEIDLNDGSSILFSFGLK
jgi:hypothetical protein